MAPEARTDACEGSRSHIKRYGKNRLVTEPSILILSNQDASHASQHKVPA